MKERFGVFIIFLLLTVTIAGYPTFAESKTSLSSLFSGETSEQLVIQDAPPEIDFERKSMTYSFPAGSAKLVHVIYGSSEMFCRRIEIYYDDAADKNAKDNRSLSSDKISKIVIQGDIRVTRTDGTSVSADSIVYTKADEKMVMTGNPVVIIGDGYKMENARIIYDLSKDKLTGEDADTGTSRTTIYPNKLKGSSSVPQQR